jgi:class 3 adenylate cyclase
LLEASGDVDTALAHARKAVAVESSREEGHGHLIRLLAASGQPDVALRQFKELERLLDEELGEEPSPSLRALARQIEKQSGLTAPPVPAPAARTPQPAPTPAAAAGMPATLTFLMTDIEGSTRQWERAGEPFRQALAAHHALLRDAFARHGGQEIKEAGDSFLVAFAARKGAQLRRRRPAGARGAGMAAGCRAIRVRMALHTGDVERSAGGEYHGLMLHRTSRMLTAAHGGQILLSEVTAGWSGANWPTTFV